jgi:hypothetical protein
MEKNKIYLTGPFTTKKDRKFFYYTRDRIKEHFSSYEIVTVEDIEGYDSLQIYDHTLQFLLSLKKGSDVIVAIINGNQCNDSTAFEMY